MRSLRSTFRSHRWLAALVLLAALLLRIAVPAGFMPMVSAHGLRLVPCSGTGPIEPAPVSDPHAVSGMQHAQAHAGHGAPATHAPAAHTDHGDAQVQSGCAFAELAMPLMPGADPIQLAAALLFIAAAALFFRAALPRRAEPRLRPPLRGPPFLA